MTGLTSSSNRTRSPITIAAAIPALPGENAAHDVRPMKGGSFQPSTATSTSFRGNDTLMVPSGLFSGFSTPVAVATAASSMGGESTTAGAWSAAATGAPGGAEGARLAGPG